MRALDKVGLPAIIRPAFTLGGTGGGVAYNRDEFEQIVRTGLDASPAGQILIDESLLGWKEFEMEVVRDKADNCIIVCSIENVDPMGVHTGDSITVAPALTLTDKEYQMMRNASIAVLREIGVETGGSNVQFAVNPDDGRLVVIEMNPRVSRSSALASKATGFPIAKVAAKLAVGYTLDELENDITAGRRRPRSNLPSTMSSPKSALRVREVSGRFAHADDGHEVGRRGDGDRPHVCREPAEGAARIGVGPHRSRRHRLRRTWRRRRQKVIRAELGVPTPERLLKVAQAMRLGFDHEQIYASCRIDPWFLARIQEIIDVEARVLAHGLPKSAELLRQLKPWAFRTRASPNCRNRPKPRCASSAWRLA
jgi:carbamoyl-phosphate synthase large subunit